MYLAEIRGKLSRENENKEDILTSNVFSFFKYANRADFLYLFMQSLGIEATPTDAMQAEFLFWPRYDDNTEPDLVILIGNYYLLFESKYLSGFGKETPTNKHQLVREIDGGASEAKNMGREFRIFAITADHFEKPGLKSAIPDRFLPVYKWVNWQSIAWFLYRVLGRSEHLSSEARLFAEDLYQLLLRKNLRGYEGTKTFQNSSIITLFNGDIFFKASTASFRGDFIGFTRALEQEELTLAILESIFFAAATAQFRGDFIGFDVALNSGELHNNPGQIFLKQEAFRLFQIQIRPEGVKPVPKALFFKRR